MVNVVFMTVVGIPEITPVAASNFKPGSDNTGVIENPVIGPPVFTGMGLETGSPTLTDT